MPLTSKIGLASASSISPLGETQKQIINHLEINKVENGYTVNEWGRINVFTELETAIDFIKNTIGTER